MKELLEYLIKNIVDQQDDVQITEETDETGTIIFKVKVSPEDVGKVIGKKGKIINSVRNIVRIKAIKTNQRARVEVINPPSQESDSQIQQPEQSAPAPANQPAVETMPQNQPEEMPQAEAEQKSEPVLNQVEEKPEPQPEPEMTPAEPAPQTDPKTEVSPEPGLAQEKTVEELTQPQN